MRIAWASPLNVRSAIGRESVRVTSALAERGWDITLIGLEHDRPEEPLHETQLPVRHWRDVRPGDLADLDAVVVNLGDNFAFHGGAFALLEMTPCLAIFHDFYLHNLFNGWLHDQGRPQGLAEAVLVSVYGEERGALAGQAARGELSLTDLADVFPMTEWMAEKCAAALVHAEFYRQRVASACPGPVGLARLPVAPRPIPPLRPGRSERLRLLTVGVMNPNKGVDLAIQAIAASPELAARVEYRLVGPIEAAERERLTALAAELGYEGLRINGPADEAELNTELASADIICCLRKPVLEGSSGSAVEGLLSGRPVIVANAGFYGELPDELAFKVPGDIPVPALTAVIERLAGDEPLRRGAGAKARAWALQTFALDQYLDGLIETLAAAGRTSAWLEVADGFARDLTALGFTAEDRLVDHLGWLITDLCRAPAP